MEEIFAIPGFYQVSRKICHGLDLKSLKNLCHTNKTIMDYCTSIWLERCLNQKNGFNEYFRTPSLLERSVEFDVALAKFLKDMVKIFKILNMNKQFIKIELNRFSFRSQVRFIPSNVPTSMHNQMLNVLCIAMYYQDLESVINVLRPIKNYDTCVRTLIRAHDLSYLLEMDISKQQIGGMAPFWEKIMKKCKNPNAPNEVGSTAMHLVAKLGLFKIAEVLLPYCNNLDARDQDGKTSLDIAMEWKHHKTVEILNSGL